MSDLDDDRGLVSRSHDNACGREEMKTPLAAGHNSRGQCESLRQTRTRISP
jgi:hypothetical protein